jgi:hypothetical protein
MYAYAYAPGRCRRTSTGGGETAAGRREGQAKRQDDRRWPTDAAFRPQYRRITPWPERPCCRRGCVAAPPKRASGALRDRMRASLAPPPPAPHPLDCSRTLSLPPSLSFLLSGALSSLTHPLSLSHPPDGQLQLRLLPTRPRLPLPFRRQPSQRRHTRWAAFGWRLLRPGLAGGGRGGRRDAAGVDADDAGRGGGRGSVVHEGGVPHRAQRRLRVLPGAGGGGGGGNTRLNHSTGSPDCLERRGGHSGEKERKRERA